MNVKYFRLFFLSLVWSVFFTPTLTSADVNISRAPDGRISFGAQDATLAEIVKELFDRFTIEVNGLENRENQKITFSYTADTPEDLLKSLLRHFGIKNFAFEFTDATLQRLIVLPESSDNISSFSESAKDTSQQNAMVGIAMVQSIVESSQAESAGLQAGDIILEYDGVPISSAQQLVDEVENKSESRQVEMVLVRHKIPTRLILSGGFIGVRVMTRNIPREEFVTYQESD
jgi:membrane-associated protease RseP (regulator of RpoE activity)